MPLTPVTQVDRLKLQVRHVCKLVISKIVSKILRVDGFNKLNIGLVDSEAQVPFIAAFVSLFVCWSQSVNLFSIVSVTFVLFRVSKYAFGETERKQRSTIQKEQFLVISGVFIVWVRKRILED